MDASRHFEEACIQYHQALKKLRPRISKPAWNFFESGHGQTGLHDGRLLSLSVGDGLDYRANGTVPFRLNRQTTVARIVFLNHEQSLLYTFNLRGINSIRSELTRSEAPSWCLGDLFTYEIVAIDRDLLQLGFLFASGASIITQFRKLIFRRQRIKRKNGAGKRHG